MPFMPIEVEEIKKVAEVDLVETTDREEVVDSRMVEDLREHISQHPLHYHALECSARYMTNSITLLSNADRALIMRLSRTIFHKLLQP